MVQTEVDFLNQVLRGNLGRLVSLGNGHHQPKIGLHERIGRPPRGDQSPQLTLVRGCDLLTSGQLGPGVTAGFDWPWASWISSVLLAERACRRAANEVLLELYNTLGGHSPSSVVIEKLPR